ncbi:MAG TPA: phytoene desaturase family protein [Spirochaetia bacterium]|nr:phytoene desaturase family protein [Spirochaetia bacterium]
MSKESVLIVGAGIGGLSLANLLARRGFSVRVLEKNETSGGRARIWKKDGFTFDMGPSWYLMPEVFERYFESLGERRKDHYDLSRLDPSYRVFFTPGKPVDLYPDAEKNESTFEGFEKGGGRRLQRYLEDARYKYDTAMREFVYRDYTSVAQFLNRRMLVEGVRLNLLGSLDRHVRKFFHDRRARQALEYHMVFLGSSPYNAPGMYSIMSHVDLTQGVFYPQGGMGRLVASLEKMAAASGVEVLTGHEVTRIVSAGGRARGVVVDGRGRFDADIVCVNADYAFTETKLLDRTQRSYSASSWDRRVLAPSFFILYLGLAKKLRSPLHHTLYLAPEWDKHFTAIFSKPAWPEDPCFYLSCTSKTDPTVAPAGCEALVALVPVAAGLPDGDDERRRYRDSVIGKVQDVLGEKIEDAIRVERVFSPRDFLSDYNAYKGTGLGLAHTLRQTAIFRPSHRSRKLSNLYYTGAYTHPGVGVPMTLISSQLVADQIASPA